MSDIITVVSIFISLVVLITFFKIAGSTDTIAARLTRIEAHQLEQYKAAYYVHYVNSNKAAARDSLLYLIFSQLANVRDNATRKKEFDNFRQKYEKHFTRLGYEFPAYPFD